MTAVHHHAGGSDTTAAARVPTDPTTREIHTTRFGTIRPDDGHTFALPDGIPGFGDLGGLVVIPVDDDALFVWLQSLDDGSLAFLAVNPWPFFPDYEIEIGDADLDALGITDDGDVLVYCLVRAERDEHRFSVNLLAPIVFGVGTGCARQITLDGDLPLAAPLATPSAPTTPSPLHVERNRSTRTHLAPPGDAPTGCTVAAAGTLHWETTT